MYKSNKMPQKLRKGTQKGHTRRKNKYTKKRQSEMIGGSFFGLFGTSKATKFAYILADTAYKYATEPSKEQTSTYNSSGQYITITLDYNTSDYKENTKELLLKTFRKMFIKFIEQYKNSRDIKDNTGDTKNIKLILESFNYKKTGADKYELETNKNDPSAIKYVNILKEIIKEYVKLLKKNEPQKYSNRVNNIQAPEILKSSGETYATITIYDNNNSPKIIPNILYRINRPEIKSNDKHAMETKKRKRYELSKQFYSSYSDFAEAFNNFVIFKVGN